MDSLTSNQKGEIAKLKVELRAAQKGWTVSRTIEGARYDLILDDGTSLYRAQVKWAEGKASHSQGSVSLKLTKNAGDDRNKVYRRTKTRVYTTNEVDVILAYIPQVEKVCWLGSQFFDGKTSIVLRFSPAKKQYPGLHLVDDLVW